MAGGLKRILPAALAAASLLSAAMAGELAPLPDPTRPPEGMETVEAKPGKPAAAAAGLQTVIMRKGKKPVAVINGETVELGGKLGEATLVKLGEREAVLQGPQGREVLRLTPDAEKKPVGKGGAATVREVKG